MEITNIKMSSDGRLIITEDMDDGDGGDDTDDDQHQVNCNLYSSEFYPVRVLLILLSSCGVEEGRGGGIIYP